MTSPLLLQRATTSRRNTRRRSIEEQCDELYMYFTMDLDDHK